MLSRFACSAAAALSLCAVSCFGETKAFRITDDPALSRAVTEARAEYLKNKTFNRLDAAILVPDPDGTWRRGSHNGTTIAYPASCVKLAYLAAAMHWCRENKLPYTHLDHCVRPMIVKSDNVQTGVTVDAITSTTNDAAITTATDPRFDAWYRRRLYTEDYLRSRGLLENQVIVHKTYPTNSGESPAGAEKAARELRGPNRMQPNAAANLMLEIVKGAIEPEAKPYMMELLEHDRWKNNSVLGFGLPPGTKYYNKPGLAYDTLEDIAYVVLPNGREFVVAAFSNGFTPPYSQDPDPHDGSVLGGFMEILLEKTGLAKGCPPVVRVDNASDDFTTTGTWAVDSTSTDSFGANCAYSQGAAGPAEATWHLRVPEAGRYEVCVWYTQGPNRAGDAPFVVRHAGGETTASVNQKKVGGRWVRLGDFEFAKGGGEVLLGNRTANPAEMVVGDAVKASRWP